MASRNNDDKCHPAWMVVVLAISIVIAALVWMPGWMVPNLNYKPDRLPSLSPTNTKIILVDVVGLQNNPLYVGQG